MTWRRLAAICLSVIVGGSGCSELKDDALGPEVTEQESLTYQRDIQPLLQQNCVSCHSGAQASGKYDLTTMSGVVSRGSDATRNAISGNANSLLITILSRADHAGHIGSADNRDALYKWVVADGMGLRQPEVHPRGFNDLNSQAFHGNALAQDGYDMAGCRGCHGSDYAGGVAESSCLQCHTGSPEDCSTCHGSGLSSAPPLDLSGDFDSSVDGVGAHQAHLMGGDLSEAVPCAACHTVPKLLHASGHVDTAPPAEVLLDGFAATGGLTPAYSGGTCSNTYCHGSATPSWTGGSDEASCGSCHGLPPMVGDHPQVDACDLCHGDVVDADRNIVNKALHVNGQVEVAFGHPDGFANPASENFHSAALKASGWKLSDCQSCHGTDYAGGTVGETCLTCHPSTPEACSTCHGSLTNPAPPKDLDDNTATTVRTVGAHQSHVVASGIARALDCSECHLKPAAMSDAGHLDGTLPAELAFGSLAVTGGLTPAWDGQTCSNTYCHGTFEGGTDAAPVWTEVGTGQAACGSCHALPPPSSAGHPQVDNCSLCHPRVADSDRNIVDKTLHMNGSVEIGQ
jgi:predicted CxxxxCH...CXXCH cytochrome family protein